MTNTLNMPLRRCRPSEDVIPFSECRNNLSTYIARVRETRRPVLITQNGRAASYLVDAEFLDNVFDQLELARDINISRREWKASWLEVLTPIIPNQQLAFLSAKLRSGSESHHNTVST